VVVTVVVVVVVVCSEGRRAGSRIANSLTDPFFFPYPCGFFRAQENKKKKTQTHYAKAIAGCDRRTTSKND
jgi:hypothetical protein